MPDNTTNSPLINFVKTTVLPEAISNGTLWFITEEESTDIKQIYLDFKNKRYPLYADDPFSKYISKEDIKLNYLNKILNNLYIDITQEKDEEENIVSTQFDFYGKWPSEIKDEEGEAITDLTLGEALENFFGVKVGKETFVFNGDDILETGDTND